MITKVPAKVTHSNGQVLHLVYKTDGSEDVHAHFESKCGTTWMKFQWLNGEIQIESKEAFVGSMN